MNGAISPKSTLAIFLGASSYPKAPKLADGKAFSKSASDLREYFVDAPRGLRLPKSNIKWLFDDQRSPSDQLEDLGTFLSQFRNVEDVFIYYVGHGLFARGDRAYCLAVQTTNANHEGATSIRASDLAQILKEQLPFARRYLVLDCCFAAACYKEFQSAPLQSVFQQLAETLPDKGTALLCSSSANDVSLAPLKGTYTMFSGALLQVLKDGRWGLGPQLSFGEVGELVREHLQKTCANSVRPQVLVPEQSHGDISAIPFFPNPSTPPPPPPPVRHWLKTALWMIGISLVLWILLSGSSGIGGGGHGGQIGQEQSEQSGNIGRRQSGQSEKTGHVEKSGHGGQSGHGGHIH